MQHCCFFQQMYEKRMLSERPESVEEMTEEHLQDEKVSIQKELSILENMFGQTTARNEDLFKPIYNRYRTVKRHLARTTASVSLLLSFKLCTRNFGCKDSVVPKPGMSLFQLLSYHISQDFPQQPVRGLVSTLTVQLSPSLVQLLLSLVQFLLSLVQLSPSLIQLFIFNFNEFTCFFFNS